MGYKVKKGDGWYKIAKTLGVDVNELLKANNATLDTQLHPDQELQTTATEKPVGVSGLWGVDRAGAAKEWSDQQVKALQNQAQKAEENAKKDLRSRKDKIYKGQPDRTYQETLDKDRVQKLQQQLRAQGYDIGKFGADGIIGNDTKAALAAAEKDGWIVEDNKLIKKQSNQPSNEDSQIFGLAGPEYSVMALGQLYHNNPNKYNTGLDEVSRRITPRQYTAAQNTVDDLIVAPTKRLIGKYFGSDVANKILPTKTYNENHISNELYTWLQGAIDKQWPAEERQQYFEKNPDAKVSRYWHGRINGSDVNQSDYQKHYGTSYTGPMKYGFKETMFGDGIAQAQGTLGSFDIVYTKDGAYVVDDWNFGTGKNFDTSTPMGMVRQAAEHWGSQENSSIEPVKSLKALIKYKN